MRNVTDEIHNNQHMEFTHTLNEDLFAITIHC